MSKAYIEVVKTELEEMFQNDQIKINHNRNSNAVDLIWSPMETVSCTFAGKANTFIRGRSYHNINQSKIHLNFSLSNSLVYKGSFLKKIRNVKDKDAFLKQLDWYMQIYMNSNNNHVHVNREYILQPTTSKYGLYVDSPEIKRDNNQDIRLTGKCKETIIDNQVVKSSTHDVEFLNEELIGILNPLIGHCMEYAKLKKDDFVLFREIILSQRSINKKAIEEVLKVDNDTKKKKYSKKLKK